MVTIFRIGHRIFRDKRITTHLALVSRAFGASGMIIAGDKDEKIIKTVKKVVTEWGGDFTVEFVPFEEWKPFFEEWIEKQNKIIHLTMYGENLPVFKQNKEFINLRSSPELLKNLLVVVGGKKVPSKVFHYANWNIAISNQPHSEVGSLAIFLSHLIPNSLEISFPNSSRQILPSIEGKKSYFGTIKANERS
ncbi:MAG: tRNA (cytidine(56)-2'-O)-methyltransferase [Candidatus Hodarchaeales archaeon]